MNYQYQYITNHQDDKDFAPIIKWDRKRLNVDLRVQMECYYIRDKNVFLDIFDTLLKDTESGKVRHWFYEGDENYIVQWAFEHYAKEFLGLKEWEFNQLKLEMWETDEDAELWVSRATHNQEVKRRLKEVKIYYPSYPETYSDYYELRIKPTHNTLKSSWAVWKSNGWGAEGECLVKGLTAQDAIDFRENYKVEK